MTYKTSEVNDVLSDIENILNKFEIALDQAAVNIHVANKELNSVSALASLITADMQLKSIDLIPVIDTLHGILENGEGDGIQ
jgi:virulence-associated protein VapD